MHVQPCAPPSPTPTCPSTKAQLLNHCRRSTQPRLIAPDSKQPSENWVRLCVCQERGAHQAPHQPGALVLRGRASKRSARDMCWETLAWRKVCRQEAATTCFGTPLRRFTCLFVLLILERQSRRRTCSLRCLWCLRSALTVALRGPLCGCGSQKPAQTLWGQHCWSMC